MKSIKTKGIIFLLCMILLAISSLGYITYSHFKNILVEEVNQAVVRIAKESADHLSNFIDHFVSPLNEIAENENIKSMEWVKQKEIITMQINPYYTNVAVVDLNGEAHYVDGKTVDLSDREYVRDALSGSMSFSEIIISRVTGENVIMVGLPIVQDNIVKGALIARLNVDFLAKFAETRGYGKNGSAYIISKEGSLISRPALEKSGDGYNLYDLYATNNKYGEFASFVEDSLLQEDGYGRYVFDEKALLMGYSSVEGTNWKIYIGTYEEDALRSLDGLKRIFMMGAAIALVISSIAAWIFVDRFSRPMIELDHLLSQGAMGDLTIRFMPKTNDEIGRVGQSFNRMMDKIKTLTQYDPLTSLLNQYVLEKEVDTLVHRENNNDFSIVMVAIDKFSSINEIYGYTAGDAILCEAATRIRRITDENNEVYRYKGDEFVVLSKGFVTKEDIKNRAQKILKSLNEKFQIGDKTIVLSISIGIFDRFDMQSTEEPLKAVTHATNYAKYLGGNQIQIFDRRIHDNVIDMRQLQSDIMEGLREEQFFLVYQPLFYIKNQKVAEVEALIRWNHPERGRVFPDQFIELAEQSGSIIDIDLWVLETVCKQLKRWKDNGEGLLVISVNITAKTFETPKFIPYLEELLIKYNVEPQFLQFEITERMVINNVEESILKLKKLRGMGIAISIDDFGIGYSSLSYIVRLPIDSIKIDRSFVKDISVSEEAKAIVSTIINLCKTLKITVIAEGVENKSELDYLRTNKCDIVQGYYFSKPVSIQEIEKYKQNKKK